MLSKNYIVFPNSMKIGFGNVFKIRVGIFCFVFSDDFNITNSQIRA